MALHVINYDLQEPNQNYDDLHSAIQQYDCYTHALESTWIVHTSDSVSTVRDDLKHHVDNNDRLLITKMSGAWATTFSDETTDWLHEHT